MKLGALIPGALMLLLVSSHLRDVGVLFGAKPSMSACYDPLDFLTAGLFFIGGLALLIATLTGAAKAYKEKKWSPFVAPLLGLVLVVGAFKLATAIYSASVDRLEAISREALAPLAPKMTADQARATLLEANRRMTDDPNAKLDHASGLCVFDDDDRPVVATGTTTRSFTRTHYRLDASTKYTLTLHFDDGLLERAIYETYINAEVGDVGRRTIFAWP